MSYRRRNNMRRRIPNRNGNGGGIRSTHYHQYPGGPWGPSGEPYNPLGWGHDGQVYHQWPSSFTAHVGQYAPWSEETLPGNPNIHTGIRHSSQTHTHPMKKFRKSGPNQISDFDIWCWQGNCYDDIGNPLQRGGMPGNTLGPQGQQRTSLRGDGTQTFGMGGGMSGGHSVQWKRRHKRRKKRRKARRGR